MANAKDTADSAARLDPTPTIAKPAHPYGCSIFAPARGRTTA